MSTIDQGWSLPQETLCPDQTATIEERLDALEAMVERRDKLPKNYFRDQHALNKIVIPPNATLNEKLDAITEALHASTICHIDRIGANIDALRRRTELAEAALAEELRREPKC